MKIIDSGLTNPIKITENIKKYIRQCKCPDIELDLSALNIIDAAKVLVVSSAYHYKKYPDGKLKCRTCSEDVKNFLMPFSLTNLEIL